MSALLINLGFDLEMANDHWTKCMEFGNFEVMSDQFISLRFHWMCILTAFRSDDLCGKSDVVTSQNKQTKSYVCG
jgi:hypothetical protein